MFKTFLSNQYKIISRTLLVHAKYRNVLLQKNSDV